MVVGRRELAREGDPEWYFLMEVGPRVSAMVLSLIEVDGLVIFIFIFLDLLFLLVLSRSISLLLFAVFPLTNLATLLCRCPSLCSFLCQLASHVNILCT